MSPSLPSPLSVTTKRTLGAPEKPVGLSVNGSDCRYYRSCRAMEAKAETRWETSFCYMLLLRRINPS